MFQGFTEETCEFLWGVRLNNYRDWFQPRKQTYIDSVYEPMKALGAEFEEFFRTVYPEMEMQVKVSRIYRDMRTVKAGGPYKDHLWMGIRKPCEDWTARPSFWFTIEPEGYSYGMGYWTPKPVTMEIYRRRLQRDPESFEKLVRRFNRQDRFVLEGPEYKRSKGECSDLLKPWFNRKWVGISHFHEPDAAMLTHELADQAIEGYQWLMPYYSWFRELELEPPLTD